MTTTAAEPTTSTEVTRPLESLDDYKTWIDELVSDGADLEPLIHMLVEEKFRTAEVLDKVKAAQAELREQLAALCMPEQYPVVITGVHHGPVPTVEVAGNGPRLRVSVHPKIDVDELEVGCRGLLSSKKNCLLAVFEPVEDWSEVGTVEEVMPGGERLLLRHQDTLFTVGFARSLRGTVIKKGDLVGFDREGPRLAYTKVSKPGREDLFFENTPPDRFDELGGLDGVIATMKRAVEFGLKHAAVASKYRLKPKRGILLEGPPGNGKTKLARCLARHVADLVPSGECRFMAVAGSADYSMWLGQSEQKLIARFEAAREVASKGDVPVVLFFDEIDAIGRRRGSDHGSGAPDRILATLLAQLDGMEQCPNLIVVAATNRADILDPGLVRPGRLGDVKLRLGAPNRAAGAQILRRYLAGMPTAVPEEVLVQTVLSRLYSERGVYAETARVTMRDGSRIVIKGSDLVSGALLESVVRSAAEDAAEREANGGICGLTEEDVCVALDAQMRGAANLLTAQSVRGYVTRLPVDRDAVGVEVLLQGPMMGRYVVG